MSRFPVPLPILLLLFPALNAQDKESPFELEGYLTNMQSVMFETPDGDWIIDNLFHNRLNFFWYGGKHFTGSVQLRNRLLYGESLQQFPGYANAIGKDMGLVDLSFNLLSGNSYVLNSTFDRAWFQYSRQGFTATAGRQRINWGQTIVWNVNDIFNAYSYFEIDYDERPGSDAVRLQFYPNFTSTVELAAKLDSSNKVTAAGLYRFNLFSYDIQFIAGLLAQEDFVGGLGWSGNIGGAGFRGESSYFHPVHNPGDTTGMLMFSAGIEYVFSNSLMLQGEYLYSSRPFRNALNFINDYSGTITVKQLAFTENTVFVSASYPVTPLFTASLAGMYFPELKGFFAGPTLSYNVMNNVNLDFFLQYFNAELKDPLSGIKSRLHMSRLFLRLKWNF